MSDQQQPSVAAMALAEQMTFVGFEGSEPILVIADTGVLCVSFPTYERAEEICNDVRRQIATDLDAFAAKAVEAALNHAQYLHNLDRDDREDKVKQAERARIAEAIEAFWAQGYAPGTLSAILAIVKGDTTL